jgi:4-amino-4-deoxy-L-arabinose transferase-like glycosyltransferase
MLPDDVLGVTGEEIRRLFGGVIPDLNFFKAAALLCCFAVFYLVSIRGTPIYDETEGQYAGAVRVMQSYRELPMNNDIPRLQKPPLTYGLMKLSGSLIQNQEFAMRLPFVIALLGLLLVTYAIGAEVMDAGRGCAAMTLMGVMFGIFVFGRMIMPEIFLSLFVASTFWASIRALLSTTYSSRRNWWTVAWVMMAMGSFAKGFHGLLWPLAVLGLARGLELFQRDSWAGFWSLRNLVLFLAITLPWYVFVEVKYPGFIRDNFWNEQMGHALDFRNPPTYSRVPLGHFLIQHLILLFPAILLIPHALKSFELTRDSYFQRQARKLLLLIPPVILLTSSFSARQDYYTMSCWFSVAILVVVGLDQRSHSRWLLFPWWILGALGLVLLVVWKMEGGNGGSHFRSDTSDHLFSILENLPPEIKPLMLVSGGTLMVGSLVGWVLWKNRLNTWISIALAIAMSGPLWGAGKGFRILSDSFSLKKTAVVIQSLEDVTMVVDGAHQLASSLFYYTEKPIYFVRANPEAEFATRVHGVGRDQFWSPEDFMGYWNSEESVAILMSEKDRGFWKEKLGDRFFEVPQAKSGSRILVLNHPHP